MNVIERYSLIRREEGVQKALEPMKVEVVVLPDEKLNWVWPGKLDILVRVLSVFRQELLN